MKKKIKILFATDFSAGSKIGAALTKKLQKVYSCEIYLIHIIKSVFKEWFSDGFYKKTAQERLQIWQDKVFGSKKSVKKILIDYGNPADLILFYANEIKSNLIVLTAKDHHVDKYRTGTTMESVVRYAQQSVLICKKTKISKIMCGIDGSKSSEEALKKSIEICELFSAKLTIVSVLSSVDFNPIGLTKETIKKYEMEYKTKSIAFLNEFLKKFDLSAISYEKHFPWGIPANILLGMAEDLDYDLLVVGAKGHSLFHHILIGSTAEKILRYAPCSLLVVR